MSNATIIDTTTLATTANQTAIINNTTDTNIKLDDTNAKLDTQISSLNSIDTNLSSKATTALQTTGNTTLSAINSEATALNVKVNADSGNLRTRIDAVKRFQPPVGPYTGVGALPFALMPLVVCSEYSELMVQLSGTWVGSVSVLGSVDGSNFSSLPMTKVNGQGQSSIASGAILSANGNGTYRVPLGVDVVKIEVTQYTSGTINAVGHLRTLPTAPATISADTIHRSASATSISGTITTGGTAQVLLPNNGNRRAIDFMNTSSGVLTLRLSDSALATATNDIPVPAGQGYNFPNNVSGSQRISVFGATTGQTFTVIEF